MKYIKKFEEWRAEEIVKVFLLKLDTKLSIEKYPTPLFDLFVTVNDHPQAKFAIEVKTTKKFKSKVNQQLGALKVYRDSDMLNIPVLIVKVDEKKEESEFDFLVLPSKKEDRLLIRKEFKFKKLTNENFEKKLNAVISWFEK